LVGDCKSRKVPNSMGFPYLTDPKLIYWN